MVRIMISGTAKILGIYACMLNRGLLVKTGVVIILSILGMASGVMDVHAQDVIRASGGTELSVDSVGVEDEQGNPSGFTTLDGPSIRETATGQLMEGESLTLTLPSGYEWNTGVSVMPTAAQGDIGTEDVTFTIEPVGAQNTDLELQFDEITSNTFTFTITTVSTHAGAGKGPARLTINGLELRPANTDVPDEGIITNTGTTGPDGLTNYGDLSKKAGGVAEVSVENADDGSGTVFPDTTILAGNSLTVYAIARDTGGNFIENIALGDESDWSLINISGGLTQADISPSADLQSAVFSSTATGSANIEAGYSGATSITSGNINVDPRPESEMVIDTQPPDTAVAGESFDPQPVIHLQDQFGNLVTTDNTTNITVAVESGDGTLSGNTTITADGGIASFTGLSSEIANDITLRFEAQGLDQIVSNTITVEPNDPVDLAYLQQPTNTAKGLTIDPPVELQLTDAYGNEVKESGIDVTISSEGYFDNAATLTETTNNDGVAVFDNLAISGGATEGEIDFSATFEYPEGMVHPDPPAESALFSILDGSDLARFAITKTNGDPFGDQVAGTSFDIRIEARRADGDVFTDFDTDSTAVITADADILLNGNTVESFTTDDFTAGVLDTSIILITSGLTRIYAENSVTGQSNEFTVNPADFEPDSTIISADPKEIVADGQSTSEITVQLRDEFGNNLNSGGETIILETDKGTLSAGSETGVDSLSADDQNDGTYTATLTSSQSAEEATVEAYDINDSTEVWSTTVNFVPGSVADFEISVPENGDSPIDQTAGIPFAITVEAVDQHGNIVNSYNGTIDISSNSEIDSGTSGTFTNGVLSEHPITLIKSGTDITISAEDPDLYNVSGTSPAFTVLAAVPDVTTSQVSVNPDVIQNDGSSESVVTVTLRDEFSNKVLPDSSGNLSVELVRLELDGSPVSGEPQPDATITTLSYLSATSIYQATLTSTETLELVEIRVSYAGTRLDQTPTVDIVLPNVWEPSGSPQQRNDWTRDDNWSLEREPETSDFVIIPGGAGDYPDLDLNVSIGSLEIQDGGMLVLFGGNAIDVSGEVQIDGTLDIEDNTNLSVGGNFSGAGSFATGDNAVIEVSGDVTVASLLARTTGTIVRLNGTTQQTLTTPDLLAQRLEILNDVLATSGDVIDTAELLITEGNTFELTQGAGITVDNIDNISGDGAFVLNDNTLVLRGDLNLLNIDTSEATVIFGIRIEEDFADYPELQRQQIANLSEMKNAVVNNTEGVRTYEDILVNGQDASLTLQNGPLIISSGKSLIAPDITYVNGELQFLRIITATPGWRMMSSPVDSTHGDLFDGLTVQGLTNSAYPDRQPNLLWYDETADTTALDRWRAPGAVGDKITTGRGYFFYVFGDVESDDDYNDVLPATLTASGRENTHNDGSFFDFNITLSDSLEQQEDRYVEIYELGWNLVGNPYGATINWDDAINSTNWQKSNVDDVLYIWKTEELEDSTITGDYMEWNGVTGSLGNGLIPPFQAFWVKAGNNVENADTTLAVSPAAKTTGGQFRQKAQVGGGTHKLVLSLEAGGLETATYFSFSENARIDPDPKDAYLLEPMADTFLNFYSVARNSRNGSSTKIPLVINNLPRKSESTYEIPLGVRGYHRGEPIRGTYEVRLDSETSIPDDWDVRLKDNVTGKTVELNNRSAQEKRSGVGIMTEISGFRGQREHYDIPLMDNAGRRQPVIADIGGVDGEAGSKNSEAKYSGASDNGVYRSEANGSDGIGSDRTASYADKEFPFTLYVTPDELGEGDVPNQVYLDHNYPNPFNPSTTIRFGIPEEQSVKLEVYDILGRRVQTLINERMDSGTHTTVFDGARFASGVYIYRLRTGDATITRKMTLIK